MKININPKTYLRSVYNNIDIDSNYNDYKGKIVSYGGSGFYNKFMYQLDNGELSYEIIKSISTKKDLLETLASVDENFLGFIEGKVRNIEDQINKNRIPNKSFGLKDIKVALDNILLAKTPTKK